MSSKNENPTEDQPPPTGGPQVFSISTLRDIFNLPTLAQMETCLREISEGMLQARIANDTMLETLRAAGAENLERVIEWPEVAKWTDDGKGEVTTRYGGPDGTPTFTLKTKLEV
jgi:hypothetical protein